MPSELRAAPRGDVRAALTAYADGLGPELALLGHLEALSRAQHDAAERDDTTALPPISTDREQTMQAIAAIEAAIAPARQVIALGLDEARALADFPAVAASHRRAEALVEEILARDRDTAALLRRADRDRRAAARVIEAGEATLAAYRRVIAPPGPGAGLVNQRG